MQGEGCLCCEANISSGESHLSGFGYDVHEDCTGL